MYCHLQKTSLKRIGSLYIYSPEWVKNKKATTNPKNNHNNRFQYALTTALNYPNIKRHRERIYNLKPFINKYDWKGIDFSLHFKDWKIFELNNRTIALNILFVPYNTEKIRLAYPQTKHNNKRENQVILLMITDAKKWHYLAVKSLPALLRRIK